MSLINNKSNLLELGTQKKINKKFLFDKIEYINHYLSQSQFPLAIFGSQGSSRITSALSLISQCIKNNEGYILLDNDGLFNSLPKLNNLKKTYNNTKDFYVLDFSNEETKEFKKIPIKTSSIDPINPLIGNEELFKLLFGDNFGLLVHEIAKVSKQNKSLIDYQMIRSMMSLTNLQDWVDNNIWGEVTKTISEYLQNNNEESHKENCLKAIEYTLIIERYTKEGVFSISPTLELKDVLINQSILHCQLSMWHTEFSTEFSFEKIKSEKPDTFKVMDLILLQIHHITEQLNKEFPNVNHWQNIAMLEFEYSCSNKIYSYLSTCLSNKNKWIFVGYVPVQYETLHEKNKLSIIEAASTIVLMQSNTYSSEIPDKVKLKILNNVQNLSNIFYDKSTVLLDQRSGHGYTLIKIDGKYEFIKLVLYYENLNN